MRIAVFHELHAGGARRAVNELSLQLKNRHVVDLYIVDSFPSTDEASFFSDVVFFEFVPKVWKGKNWRARLYKDTLELIKLFSLHRKIAKRIDAKKYDVVFVHPSQYTQAPFLLHFLKTKSVYYCQEPLRLNNEIEEKKNDFLRSIYDRTLRSARKAIDAINTKDVDVVLANSKFSQHTIKVAYGAASHVCYLGVDTDLFNSSDTAKDIDILFLGSKNIIDGFDLLQDAAGFLIKKPTIKIVEGRKEWRLTDEELIRLYNRSKIVVCLSRNEPFGLVPLEAMSCGVPVIATNDGGYRETIKNNKTGYLIQRDPKKLAEVIDYLLRHSIEMKALGMNGRREVLANWTWQKSAKKIEKILVKFQAINETN